jgi:hypothetical protein
VYFINIKKGTHLKSNRELETDSLKIFKDLLKKGVKKRTKDTFVTGNMVAFSYNAKDTESIYDKSPLIITLRQSNGYVLGLNFHWSPKPARKILISYILKLNKLNISKGKPLEITYKMMMPMIIKLRLKYVIRLYIKSRISARAMVIPHEFFMKAVYLPAENFSGGVSTDQLYKRAVLKSKKK